MRKLISFTLYGQDPKYIVGMHKNIALQKQFYPDWEIIIYHDDSLGDSVLDGLKPDATLVDVSGCGVLASMWRFFAHDEDDVERFIVRDADSRLSQREADAVQKWTEGGKWLHIMRDHLHHGYPMNGGMWGMQPHSSVNLRDLCLKYQRGKVDDPTYRDNWWMIDMNFLRDAIYPVANTEICQIHAARDYMHRVTWVNEDWAEDFPTPRNEDRNFVGEQFDENEQRGYQYQELQ